MTGNTNSSQNSNLFPPQKFFLRSVRTMYGRYFELVDSFCSAPFKAFQKPFWLDDDRPFYDTSWQDRRGGEKHQVKQEKQQSHLCLSKNNFVACNFS